MTEWNVLKLAELFVFVLEMESVKFMQVQLIGFLVRKFQLS